MTLSPGTTNTELAVTINTDQLEPGDYMLPIRIESVSIFGISSTNDVYPLTIRILGPLLDRTSWTIEANTQEPSGEGSEMVCLHVHWTAIFRLTGIRPGRVVPMLYLMS